MVGVPAPEIFAQRARHAGESVGQIAELRLAGGVGDHRLALGQDRGEHGVLSGADRGEGKCNQPAREATRGLGVDIAFVQVDRGAQRPQRFQVQIDRPRADRAPARQRDLGVAGARDERPQNVERGPHLTDQVVGRERADDLAGMQNGLFAIVACPLDDLGAKTLQQARQEARIGQPRHVGKSQRFVGKQAGRHQLDGGILGAADGDLTMQPRAAGDGDAIQTRPSEG